MQLLSIIGKLQKKKKTDKTEFIGLQLIAKFITAVLSKFVYCRHKNKVAFIFQNLEILKEFFGKIEVVRNM